VPGIFYYRGKSFELDANKKISRQDAHNIILGNMVILLSVIDITWMRVLECIA